MQFSGCGMKILNLASSNVVQGMLCWQDLMQWRCSGFQMAELGLMMTCRSC